MPKYFDDQKQLIANSTSELVLYFQSLSGNVAAYDVPVTLPCPATAIVQVKSTGVVPKFLYLDSPVPKNKIYPQLLQSDTVDLSPLCNNSTVANLPVTPDCGTVVCYTFTLAAPNCGTVVFISGYDHYLTLTPTTSGGWALYGDIKSSVTPQGVVTLNISVINSGITTHTSFTTEDILSISANGVPNHPFTLLSASHPNMPPSSVLDILHIGGTVRYTGYETSITPLGVVIEIFNINYNINN